MSYAEIKREITETKKRIKSVASSLNKSQDDLMSLKEQSASWEMSNENHREQEYLIQKEKYVLEKVKPIEAKINKVKENLNIAKSRYEEKMRYYDSEAAIKDFTDGADVYSDLEVTIEEVNNAIAVSVSEGFRDRLLVELGYIVSFKSLNQKQWERMKDKLEQALLEIQQTNGPAPNLELLDSLTDFIESVSSGTEDGPHGENLVMLLIAASFVAVFLTRFLAPLYLLFLTGLFALNYRRHTKLMKNAILFSSVLQNLDKIKESALQEAKGKLEKDRQAYEIDYTTATKELNSTLTGLSSKLTSAQISAEAEFQFDSVSFEDSLSKIRKQHRSKMSDIKNSIVSYETMLVELNSKLTELENNLEENIQLTKNQYLDHLRIGNSFLLKKDFLIDILPSGQPILLNFPESNILIINNNTQDYINFVNLFVLQLRNRLNPSALQIEFWDILDACIGYQHLIDDGHSVASVVTTEDKIKDRLTRLADMCNARISSILRGFQHITEYNEYMLSIDSLTESYCFYFVPNPPESLLANVTFQRVLNVCYRVGIYFIFSIEEKTLTGNSKLIDFVSVIQNFYTIEEGSLNKYASQFVYDLLDKKDF